MSDQCEHHCSGAHELVVSDITAQYGDTVALENINFTTYCGSRLALLGPNGAGKSTLIHVLTGLIKASKGTITWRGETLLKSNSEIAFLPQIDQHQKHFPISVREVVEMGRFPHVGNFRRFKQSDHDHVENAISTMQLNSIVDRQIDELSGGQKQRAFIARALAQESHVILLDEPFNGLDIESRCQLASTLETLSQNGHLIIASHHNIANVSELFDEALVVNKTQIAFGSVDSVLSDHNVQHLLHACHPAGVMV